MTIYLYSGTPGSGKSYHAARDIRDALKWKKQYVIGNFPINERQDWEGTHYYIRNIELNPQLLKDFALQKFEAGHIREDSILLVIDECQLLFNSRTWNDSNRLEWLEFFSQHRKYGYKIIFIAQDSAMIDKQFRSLIEVEVNHRKAYNYGLFGKLLSLAAFGTLFYCCEYYFLNHQKIGGSFIRYNRKIADVYNSYDTFESASYQPVLSSE